MKRCSSCRRLVLIRQRTCGSCAEATRALASAEAAEPLIRGELYPRGENVVLLHPLAPESVRSCIARDAS